MPKPVFFLPPEWYPQSGVMLTWPHAQSDWADRLDEVEPVFVEIASTIARFEKVLICGNDNEHLAHIEGLLLNAKQDLNQFVLVASHTNDTWARDHGPITVLHDDKPVIHDFVFNGWGNKFNAALDNQITVNIYEQSVFADEVPLIEHAFVLEGGSLESDGKGTLLTTAECLLSPQRNPHFTREQIDEFLIETFGLKRVLWLENGYLSGDDTDSHIDTLARYTDERTIAYVRCDDPNDEHYPALSKMELELKAFKTFDDKPYRLMALPWAKPQYDEDGRRLPATYANFLIINGAVLMPTYEDPEKDRQAINVMRECYPDREIIGINCLPIIKQNGSLHCLTMQLPKGVLP